MPHYNTANKTNVASRGVQSIDKAICRDNLTADTESIY